MKYRIKERHNNVTQKKAYVVEQEICIVPNEWIVSQYFDEKHQMQKAIFDTMEEAELFVHEDIINEKIVWEADI